MRLRDVIQKTLWFSGVILNVATFQWRGRYVT
jgi:hypothetical protein